MTALPRGFTAVVCTPAPLVDRPDRGPEALVEALRPVVRHARRAVLIAFPRGPARFVAVTSRTDTGVDVGPTHWLGPIRTVTEAEALADWLAIGGPRAPISPALAQLTAEPRGAPPRS